jgi:opacity protein-like surface antigen
LVKVTVAAVGLVTLLCMVAMAQDTAPDTKLAFAYRHQAGIRLGAWANLGETPIPFDTSGDSRYEADIKDASFYFEGYFAYRFNPTLMGELSVGIVSRGDISVEEGGFSYFGNLTLYPIQLRLKVYPLSQTSGKFYPYLMGGISVYHGRHDVQFTDDYWGFFREPSQTAVSYTVGAGMDMPIASQIGLDAAVTFMPINFSETLFTIKDYDALTITVGVKYLFSALGN